MIKTSVNTKIARARTRKAQYKVTKAKLAYKNEKNSYQDSFIEDIKAFGRVCLKRIKQLIIILIVIYVASVIWKGRYNYFVTTYTVKSHIYQANPEEASTEAPDPCGLKDVVCESEGEGEEAQAKTLPNSNLQGQSSIPALAQQYFPEDTKTAYAVIMAESGGNSKSMNWNCMYWSDKLRKMASESCRTVEDRKDAWSVDCGIMQINHIGKECPQELFDAHHNLTIGKTMQNKYGWKRWSSFRFKSASFLRNYGV